MILGWQSYQSGWGMMSGNKVLLILIVVWELFWKGKALWKSALRKEKWWFIALLLINTLGILPIAYLVWFSDKAKGKGKKK